MARFDPMEPPVRRRVAVKQAPAQQEVLEQIVDHRFADPSLLRAALTHPSAAGAARGPYSYERLEFLGDRVLGLVVAELLLARYPADHEGALTRRLVALVRREAVLAAAQAIDLARFLRSATSAGSKERDTALADGCEALIGAIYLDGGLPAAARFVQRIWAPLVDAAAEPARDPKTALQEWVQGRGEPLPEYRIVAQEGPAHRPMFTVQVQLEGHAPVLGSGSSKREAEQMAAATILGLLGQE